MDEIIYSWKFEWKKQRWATWYIVVLSIIIWLVIWGFLTKQYWMSFIILFISWLAFYLENNSEDQVKVSITELGIKIWDGFYDYSKIDSYSFIYSSEKALFLRLNLNKRWLRNIDLIVDNNTVIELKNILPSFLEENPDEELTLTEKIISLLKI